MVLLWRSPALKADERNPLHISNPKHKGTERAKKLSVVPFSRRPHGEQPLGISAKPRDRVSNHELVSALLKNSRIHTPFLAVRSSYVENVLGLFTRHLPDLNLFYAMKSNPTPRLVRFLLDGGIGLDAASSNELRLAIRLGAIGEKLIVSNPFKNERLLFDMFENKVNTFVVDSPGEIVKVARFRDKFFPQETACRPMIRISVPTQGIEVDLSKKFGCNPSEALGLLRLCMDLGFNPVGLCFHVGTQCVHPETYGWALDICRSILLDAYNKLGCKLEIINVGGGFCSPARAKQHGISHEEYFLKLSEVFQEALSEIRSSVSCPISLIAEPGRIFCSGAGIAVTQVLGRVDRPDGPSVYLDDGVYGSFSTKLVENIEYEFGFIPSGAARSQSRLIPYTVFGPTCDSIDQISRGALLPSHIEVGDFVYSPETGAYSITTACSFNGFPPPPVYFIKELDGSYEVVSETGDVVHVEQVGPDKKSVANLT